MASFLLCQIVEPTCLVKSERKEFHLNLTPPQSTTIKVAQAKNFEENQIRQLMQNLFDAIRLKDMNGILSCYDDDVVAYDVRDALQTDKANLRKSWQECFDTCIEFTVEALDLQIKTDQTFATAFGLVHAQGVTTEGEDIDVWMRSTSILHKIDGKWIIIHEHMSVPGDFASGKILQDLKPNQFN